MITYQQISSYHSSIIKVYHLIQECRSKGYLNIVIPSRGVCPIFQSTELFHISKTHYETRQFEIDNIEGRMEYRKESFHGYPQGSIWLPFTAQTGNPAEDQNTYQIRLNWCKVLKSILTKQSSINSIAYHVLTDSIGKSYGRTRSIIIKDKPFLIIDTAVSGRAATEILKAFEEIGLNDYHMILAVDKKGNKLEKKYRSDLLGKYLQRVSLVYFDDLFTEDQSPIFTQVFGVIYPNLTRALREEFDDSSLSVGSMHMENGNDVLCKTDLYRFLNASKTKRFASINKVYFQCQECREIGDSYNSTRGMLQYLFYIFDCMYLDEQFSTKNAVLSKILQESIPYQIEELNKKIDSGNYSKTSTTQKLFERTTRLNFKINSTVSSSHVVRCDLEEKDIDRIISKIKRQEIKYQNQYRY